VVIAGYQWFVEKRMQFGGKRISQSMVDSGGWQSVTSEPEPDCSVAKSTEPLAFHARVLSIRALPFVLLFPVALYALFRPQSFEQWFVHSDKAGHVGLFMVLSWACFWWLRPRRMGGAVLLAMLLLCLALETEWIQGGDWLPLRQQDAADLLANGVGVLCGSVLGWLSARKRSV
jgi:hypothetical protein